MRILPAIDLLSERVVRLKRGDYSDVTVYSDDPIAYAENFRDCGARDLHIVDLAGAKFGSTEQITLISKIIASTNLDVEVGGGIRSLESISRYIEAGAARVILGTAALEDPKLLEAATAKYGDKIAVGVDMKDGKVALRGWIDVTDVDGIDFCKKMVRAGVGTLIVTDISRDGMLAGTNLALYKKLASELDVKIIASGGVSSTDDVRMLSSAGVWGAILGRAMYEGKLTLKDALAALI